MLKVFIWSGSGSEHKICAYQSTIIFNFFKENNYNLVKSPINADLIILNWYPFEEFEEKINLLTINYYLIKYSSAKIILTGSIPWMMPYLNKLERVKLIWLKNLNKFDDDYKVNVSINDIVVDNVKFFVPLNLESLNIDKYWYSWMNIESKYNFLESDYKITLEQVKSWEYGLWKIFEYDTEKYSYLEDLSWEYPIEICTWCWWFCSYCDIRNVAGFVKSLPLDLVVKKIKRGISLWYKEFHFIDEDSASYWLDLWIDFADLLNNINKIDWDFKIKIFYFEPWRLEKLFEKIDISLWKKIINFCVPLQTTSQRILKLMNRKYNINNVINISNKIRSYNKNIIITTQFIYWFPSETFDEFKDYFKMLNYYDELWFWYYSDRLWTKSVNFNLKISKKELSKRMVFLWKIKERYIERVFDKNQTLKIWLNIINSRKF